MKNLVYPLIILFSFGNLAVSAQETKLYLPDSLLHKLKENEDENAARAVVLCEVLDYCNNQYKIKNCYDYILELSEISSKIGSLYFKAVSDYYMGGYLCENDRNTEAMKYFNSSLVVVETLKKSFEKQELKAKLYLAKGYCLMSLNMYSDSYNCIQNGLKITENEPKMLRIDVGLLTNKSALVFKTGKYDEAFTIMKDAIAKSKLTSASPYLLYLNISSYYSQCGLYKEAMLYCDSAKKYVRNDDDRKNSIIQSGNIYANIKDFKKAEDCFLSILKNPENTKKIRLLYSNKGMSNIMFDKKDYKSSLEYIEAALALAQDDYALNEELACLNIKMEILKRLKRYKEAFDVYDRISFLSDSLNDISKVEQLELNKAQQEIRQMEDKLIIEKEASKIRQRIILIIAFSLFTILLVILFAVYYEKKRKEKYLAEELNLRNREITSKSMIQIQNNELLTEIIEKLEIYENNPKGSENIRTIIKDLQKILNDGTKRDFDYYFVKVHPGFYERLLADFPKLTPNELRLCAYIKANLNIKDVANLTNVSAESVKSARKRLRKSLDIVGEKTSIIDFLSKY